MDIDALVAAAKAESANLFGSSGDGGGAKTTGPRPKPQQPPPSLALAALQDESSEDDDKWLEGYSFQELDMFNDVTQSQQPQAPVQEDPTGAADPSSIPGDAGEKIQAERMPGNAGQENMEAFHGNTSNADGPDAAGKRQDHVHPNPEPPIVDPVEPGINFVPASPPKDASLPIDEDPNTGNDAPSGPPDPNGGTVVEEEPVRHCELPHASHEDHDHRVAEPTTCMDAQDPPDTQRNEDAHRWDPHATRTGYIQDISPRQQEASERPLAELQSVHELESPLPLPSADCLATASAVTGPEEAALFQDPQPPGVMPEVADVGDVDDQQDVSEPPEEPMLEPPGTETVENAPSHVAVEVAPPPNPEPVTAVGNKRPPTSPRTADASKKQQHTGSSSRGNSDPGSVPVRSLPPVFTEPPAAGRNTSTFKLPAWPGIEAALSMKRRADTPKDRLPSPMTPRVGGNICNDNTIISTLDTGAMEPSPVAAGASPNPALSPGQQAEPEPDRILAANEDHHKSCQASPPHCAAPDGNGAAAAELDEQTPSVQSLADEIRQSKDHLQVILLDCIQQQRRCLEAQVKLAMTSNLQSRMRSPIVMNKLKEFREQALKAGVSLD